MSILDNIKKIPVSCKPNFQRIPVTAYSMTEDGVEEFNKVYDYLKGFCKTFNEIRRTPSGGISYKKPMRLPQWDVKTTKSLVEITVLCRIGMFRIQLRVGTPDDRKGISGTTAYRIFKSICKDFDVNLEDYEVDNGFEVKQTIPSPPIKLARPLFKNKIFEHVNHIDLNSSFMSGIAEAFPELRKPIEKIYRDRNKYDYFKDVLTHTYGYFQCKLVNYRFSLLSKVAVEFNNRMIETISNNLREQGFTVICYNTDGIWYVSRDGRLYHDENEGTQLGQWKHDHINTTWQAKSDGAYHFVEDNVCYTKLRGRTRLDRLKPRDKKGRGWSWNDLYDTDAEIFKIKFVEGEGAYIV